MTDVEGALSVAERRELRVSIANDKDEFILALPKIELHIHIGGIIDTDMRWRFSQRNGQEIINRRTGAPFASLEELRDSHDTLKPREGGRQSNAEETLSFFDALYGGYEAVRTELDYYELAMHYFKHAAATNVRYCELFFNPQGHTRNGTLWETMMSGFRKAQIKAERELKVKSAWILSFLRDESPESAMEHYVAALDYRDMIVGVGLDSNEDGRPPMLFQNVFTRARADGFRLTAHCDVGKTYPLDHIRQVVSTIGETGVDRIDHGLNAVDDPDLVKLIHDKGIGMTITPWSYIRHQALDDVSDRIRAIFDAGIRISIGSDDPALMEDTWIQENLLVVKRLCGFSDYDMTRLAMDAVTMCWAPQEVKDRILKEITQLALEMDQKSELHTII